MAFSPRQALAPASLLLLGLAVAFAGHTPPPGQPTTPTFEKDIHPVLLAHCVKCHGDTKPKGGVNLATFPDANTLFRARKLWRAVTRQVESGAMPPEGQPRLSAAERDLLVRGVNQAVLAANCSDAADRDSGASPLRRLSRSEYNHTIRDLLGLPFDVAEAVGLADESPGASTLSPALMEKYFAAADKLLDRLFAAKPEGDARSALDKLLVARPAPDLPPREAARKILTRFARLAYRRPVSPDEVDRLLALFDRVAARGGRFEDGIRLALKAALVSPHFLFRAELDRAPQDSAKPYRVTDHELAVRLSYFLWASMPDEELSRLADRGELSDPVVLDRQVRRMLADPKARSLADDFAVQWLQLNKLAEARPSTEFFPSFTQPLREAMYGEVAAFFDGLRTEDRSVLDLLEADYSYLNQDLAGHYGIAGVEGRGLRKVALKPGDHRGGLLGMGGVLAMTSHTSRTSPTLRGKWVLEVIFGTPPPPPPPDVGKLDEAAAKGNDPKTFRELLARHASRPACAGCHGKIDPLGFGLENYDAVGRWRDGVTGLDTSGRLPSGETFAGPAELRGFLLRKRDDFVNNLARQLLTYALGRPPGYEDEWAVQDVVAELKKGGCRFSALVAGVAKSYPFQHRRNTDAAGADR
jgi:mono/diheme cytochrome c family protein